MNDIYGFFREGDLANYADDNTLSYVGETINKVQTVLSNEANRAIHLFDIYLMEANPEMFQVMLLSKSKHSRSFDFDITVGDKV